MYFAILFSAYLKALKDILDGVAHLFYPSLCEGCGKPLLRGEEVLCISCGLELPATSDHEIPGNETELRLAGRIPFVRATSFAYFTDEGLLQHLLHELKYKDKKEIGVYLGKQFGCSLKPVSWVSEINAIIPVPLHPHKEAVRGYNQSLLVASGMGSALGIPVITNVLIRSRLTESQTRKTREERLSNMDGAFSVNKEEKIEGKHVLLIDDVLTTGATLEACALALGSVKNIKISIAAVGIAIT